MRALIANRIAELDRRWRSCLVTGSSIALGATLLVGCGGDTVDDDTDGSGGSQATGGTSSGGANSGGADSGGADSGGANSGGAGGGGTSGTGGSAPTSECDGTADCPTACADDADNDADGMTDCADPDCLSSCAQPAYGIPFEDCTNNLDDDGDHARDCGDSDCAEATNCLGQRYAAPLETECNNGQDDDGDGYIDCADGNCTTDMWCTAGAVPLYAIPY